MPMENLFLGRTAEKTFVGAPTTVGTSMIARSGRHVQVRVPRRSMHVWDLSTKWVAVVGCVQPALELTEGSIQLVALCHHRHA